MGQKVNPISMRLQVNKDWRSKWFAGKREYATYLKQDLSARQLIIDKLGSRAAINKVDIERSPNLVTVTIQTAKAGVVIGRGGSGAAELKNDIEKLYVEKESMETRGLKESDFIVPVKVISAQEMADLMLTQDVILSF